MEKERKMEEKINSKRCLKWFLGGMLFGGAIVYNFFSLSKDTTVRFERDDLNKDGLKDILLFNDNDRYDGALIQQEDGSFLRCDVILQDGFPFYRTEDGKKTFGYNGTVFEVD